MRDVLLNLLRQERVSSIMKIEQTSYRDLYHVSVFYTKGGKYFIARSFYTDAWIAKTPVGPPPTTSKYISVKCIEDISAIIEVPNVTTWKYYPTPSSEILEGIYKIILEESKQFVTRLLGEYSSIIHTINFMFIPTPVIVVTLLKDKQYLGAISVDTLGNAFLINSTNSYAETIIDYINNRSKTSIYKELVQCLPETI